MEGKPKRRRRRVVPKEPWVCELCECETRGRKIRHHIQYTPIEITADICGACSARFHGQGMTVNHPLYKKFPPRTDTPEHKREDRAKVDYIFIIKVVELYSRKMDPDMLDTRVRIVGRQDSRLTH